MHESVEVDGKNRINNKKKDHIQRAESIDERRLKSFQCTLAVLFSGFFVSFFFFLAPQLLSFLVRESLVPDDEGSSTKNPPRACDSLGTTAVRSIFLKISVVDFVSGVTSRSR